MQIQEGRDVAFQSRMEKKRQSQNKMTLLLMVWKKTRMVQLLAMKRSTTPPMMRELTKAISRKVTRQVTIGKRCRSW